MTQATVYYCQNCGKPLNTEARFCGRCGTQVPYPRPVPRGPSASQGSQPNPPPPVPSQSTPVPRTPANQTPSETIMGALPPGDLRSGILGMHVENFVLVLTNNRILVAKQTSALMKENARMAKENARQSGKGFFGQWGAVMGSSGSQRYMQMQPQAILQETAGNYSIPNNQIRSVRIKENHDFETSQSEVKLTLKTTGTKIELIYRQGNKKELKQALQQTLGNIVH